MKMELIQPFINAADAVLSQGLSGTTKVGHLAMEEDGYRRKGLAAVVSFKGQIEGRLILDMEPGLAAALAACLAGGDVDPSDAIVPETVCELANMVSGNAFTQLNDRGFQFRVFPPTLLTEDQCAKIGSDSEATVLSFDTPGGVVHLNISMRYHSRRTGERLPAAVS